MAAEAALAKRLLAASDVERESLYGEVYDEIYSMHFKRAPGVLEFGASPLLMPLLLDLTDQGQEVLEVGCGTGLLSIELARRGRIVTGLDVSTVALEHARRRAVDVPGANFEQIGGLDLGPAESYDFAFSIEVLEHLHERDVPLHLSEVLRVLNPGGAYWILTPHPLGSGGVAERFGVSADAPGDVHLKEWTYTEIGALLAGVGFADIRMPFPVARVGSRRQTRAPRLAWMTAFERTPQPFRLHPLVRFVLGRVGISPASCSVLARKPAQSY